MSIRTEVKIRTSHNDQHYDYRALTCQTSLNQHVFIVNEQCLCHKIPCDYIISSAVWI